MKSLIMDCHTHSSFSPDATGKIYEMYKKAAELGLEIFAVTDHCDCNFWDKIEDTSSNNLNLIDKQMYGSKVYSENSILNQEKFKNLYSDKLTILTGIELGQPLQNIPASEKIVNDKRIDFIIGSHHQNINEPDFYWIEYNKLDLCEIHKLLTDFFKQTFDMCKWGKFDVLGHLTYPLRYICGEYKIEINLKKYEEVIREIFCTIIQNGKGIEINTSGLRQKYANTFPTLEYVKLYKECGGEIVTIGSDSHSIDDIGKGVAYGTEIAREAGFQYLSYFVKHNPHFVKIV